MFSVMLIPKKESQLGASRGKAASAMVFIALNIFTSVMQYYTSNYMVLLKNHSLLWSFLKKIYMFADQNILLMRNIFLLAGIQASKCGFL